MTLGYLNLDSAKIGKQLLANLLESHLGKFRIYDKTNSMFTQQKLQQEIEKAYKKTRQNSLQNNQNPM